MLTFMAVILNWNQANSCNLSSVLEGTYTNDVTSCEQNGVVNKT